jgi:hypothetical protein
MRYVLLLPASETASKAKSRGGEAEMHEYVAQLAGAGVLLAAERLSGDADAPVAGFILIEVRSRDEAAEWASRYPVQWTQGGEPGVAVHEVTSISGLA